MTKLCVMCGKEKATTVDHVPPKGIYPKPRPNNINLNTVPACVKCNNESCSEDEVFKVVIGMGAKEQQQGYKPIVESVAKTLGSNKKLGREVFSTATPINFINENGVLTKVVAVSFETEKYAKVITKIVKGLYWKETGNILGESSNIIVYPLSVMSQEFVLQLTSLMEKLQPKYLNMNTFTYKVYFEEEKFSIWGMKFPGDHISFAYIENKT